MTGNDGTDVTVDECGVIHGHELRTTTHGDGYVTLECARCGTEIFDEGDEW